jgi:hypothetical protein
MPRFDCENSPSMTGPNPYLYWCHTSVFGNPPMPVRRTSPLGSTTSKPHTAFQWSFIGVRPPPRSSALPSGEPQPGSAGSIHTLSLRSWM